MRKMYSENQIVNSVNKAINNGEISAGVSLYKHSISVNVDGKSTTIGVVSTRSTSYDLANLEKDARAAKIFSLYGSVYTSNVMKTFIGFVVGSTGTPVIASIKMDDNTIVLYQVESVTNDSVTKL